VRRLRNTPIAFHIAGGLGLAGLIIGLALMLTAPVGVSFSTFGASYTPIEMTGIDAISGLITERGKWSTVAIASGSTLLALWAGRVAGARPAPIS